MDRSDVVILIKETYTQDEIGQQIATETDRLVFCNVESTSRDEFFKAGELGLKTAYKVTMFRYDYEGEKLCSYKNKKYNIYRTFEKANEEIELYLNSVVGL